MRKVVSLLGVLLYLQGCCSMEEFFDIGEEHHHSSAYYELKVSEKTREIDSIESSHVVGCQDYDKQNLVKIKEACVTALEHMKKQPASTVLMVDCDAVNNLIFRINELLEELKGK